ncbi:unnamed protein product [Amaranthus hypochondriacus]
MHLELYDFWLGHVCLNNFLMLKSLTFKFHLKILSLSRSLAGGVVHLVRHKWNGKLFPLKIDKMQFHCVDCGIVGFASKKLQICHEFTFISLIMYYLFVWHI